MSKAKIRCPARKPSCRCNWQPSGRNKNWLKVKCRQEQKFVILGYTPSTRMKTFASLLLGLREDKEPTTIMRETPISIFTPKPTYAGVKLTHPERELYPSSAITKARLAAYYEAIAPAMLPLVAERPLSLLRCPEGEGGECFYQKHHTGRLPEALERIAIREKSATREYLFVKDAAGLVACAQMGVLEIHPWGAFTRDVETPERLILDLDPAPDVPFDRVREAGFALKTLIEAVGLKPFSLITGGKGLHVIVPVKPGGTWQLAADVSRSMAAVLELASPNAFTLSMSKAKREGRIFIDTFRNARGATAVAPYSTRAKPGATVATPVSWEELKTITRADAFSLEEAQPRALNHQDIWPDYAKSRRALSPTLLKKLGQKKDPAEAGP